MAELVGLGELLELLVGFWRYLFSSRFRREMHRDWRRRAATRRGRIGVNLEIVVAILIGLGLPALLVWWALSWL